MNYNLQYPDISKEAYVKWLNVLNKEANYDTAISFLAEKLEVMDENQARFLWEINCEMDSYFMWELDAEDSGYDNYVEKIGERLYEIPVCSKEDTDRLITNMLKASPEYREYYLHLYGLLGYERKRKAEIAKMFGKTSSSINYGLHKARRKCRSNGNVYFFGRYYTRTVLDYLQINAAFLSYLYKAGCTNIKELYEFSCGWNKNVSSHFTTEILEKAKRQIASIYENMIEITLQDVHMLEAAYVKTFQIKRTYLYKKEALKINVADLRIRQEAIDFMFSLSIFNLCDLLVFMEKTPELLVGIEGFGESCFADVINILNEYILIDEGMSKPIFPNKIQFSEHFDGYKLISNMGYDADNRFIYISETGKVYSESDLYFSIQNKFSTSTKIKGMRFEALKRKGEKEILKNSKDENYRKGYLDGMKQAYRDMGLSEEEIDKKVLERT